MSVRSPRFGAKIRPFARILNNAGRAFVHRMTPAERIQAFTSLGQFIATLSSAERQSLVQKASQENGWFTRSSVDLAFQGLTTMLEPKRLQAWAEGYPLKNSSAKTVGVAMAGNIPMVGFHDFLCVLIAGHKLHYKPSAKDTVLLEYLQNTLVSIAPGFADRISRTERLNGVDAVLATGSDNTARYFEYYFRNIPHILRKNRVSCAVIQGDEPEAEIALLGTDIFSYYGLGCRNVSCILIPPEYDLPEFLQRLSEFSTVLENHKYENNYTYQKSLLMLNQEQFLDNGFLLVRASEQVISPVAVLHYITYHDQEDLRSRLKAHQHQLQVVVSAKGWYPGSLSFGSAQFPGAADYADDRDTMRFLTALK